MSLASKLTNSLRTSWYQGFIFSSDSVVCTNTTEDITFFDSRMMYPTEDWMNRIKMAVFEVVKQVKRFDLCDIVSNDLKSQGIPPCLWVFLKGSVSLISPLPSSTTSRWCAWIFNTSSKRKRHRNAMVYMHCNINLNLPPPQFVSTFGPTGASPSLYTGTLWLIW